MLISNDIPVCVTALESAQGLTSSGCWGQWWLSLRGGLELLTLILCTFSVVYDLQVLFIQNVGPNKLRNKTHTTHAGQPPGVLARSPRHWSQRCAGSEGRHRGKGVPREWVSPLRNGGALCDQTLLSSRICDSLLGHWATPSQSSRWLYVQFMISLPFKWTHPGPGTCSYHRLEIEGCLRVTSPASLKSGVPSPWAPVMSSH